MAEDVAVRTYSDAEHAAFRAVNARERWNPKYEPGRGPAEYAGGDYWPQELRRCAAEMERLIPLYRIAADALEREIGADSRCTTVRNIPNIPSTPAAHPPDAGTGREGS